MENKTNRLYFIDAIRAWAILMMLQGHFIDGLLAQSYRDPSNNIYNLWQYFRGITAPVFFTASGFIFTYLLLKGSSIKKVNPRVQKGLKRGFYLIAIGYLLRSNLLGLLIGEIYPAFYLVDVLHCIGFSIIGITIIYIFSKHRNTFIFPSLLIMCTGILFLLEPIYKEINYNVLPHFIANYFTKSNGSIFTIFPWFGYTTFGGFIAFLFNRYKNYSYLYPIAIITCIILGLGLIFLSSPIFLQLNYTTGIQLFASIFYNNYLFIRLGDVLVSFGLFMLLRRFITHKTFLLLGKSTLSIYIIHFVLLYGSLTGVGLYQYLQHSLAPYWAIIGALLFMMTTTYLALKYEYYKPYISQFLIIRVRWMRLKLNPWKVFTASLLKSYYFKIKLFLFKLFRLVKN